MLRFLRNLKIWQKLGLLVLVFGAALLIMGGLYLRTLNDNLATFNSKAAGSEYLIPASNLARNAARYRGSLASFLGGKKEFQIKYQEAQQAVETDLKAIESLIASDGDQFKKVDRFRQLKQKWETLKATQTQMEARESFEQNTELISDVLLFIGEIGDASKISLDPEFGTYYLGRSVLEELPTIVEALGQLRGRGASLISLKQLTPEDKQRLLSLFSDLQGGNQRLKRNVKTAFQKDPTISDSITPLLKDSEAPFQKFSALVTTLISSTSETITIDPVQYFDTGTAAIDQFVPISSATTTLLNETLKIRQKQVNQSRNITIGIMVVGLVFGFLLAFFIARTITRQVTSISQLFNAIGIGDFDTRAEVYSEDELGQMTTSLNAMLENILSLIQSQEEREQIQNSIMKLLDEIAGVAEGDLTQEAEVTAEMTGAIADSFNFMIGELRRIISNVQEVTVNVSAAATEVQSTTEHLAEGSEAQAVQIVDTSAAIEEMAASIQQVSENAVLSARVSEQARVNAKQGSEAVQKTIYGMNGIRQQVQETAKRIKRLGESSQEIGEIVQLISDIADRTSILALNASIQAAMAGEAGRGFAVVAGEVERLAERSAEATKRISTLIKTIQSETNEAVAAMETTTREVVVGSEVANEAGKSLVEIETVSNRLAELMQSISMATKQQARGSESVAKAMGDISDITQQTAAGTKQAAVSIRKLSELADNLRVSVSTFKLPSNGHGSAY
ncbi:MAG: HAMP domain-containing protein [Acidobacteria bacterium]|nr:HAMP domain-containing protein [Acidobacteriota bacterium]